MLTRAVTDEGYEAVVGSLGGVEVPSEEIEQALYDAYGDPSAAAKALTGAP